MSVQGVKRLRWVRAPGRAVGHRGAAELGLSQQRCCCRFKKPVVSVLREVAHGSHPMSVFSLLQYRLLRWICRSQRLGKEARAGRSQYFPAQGHLTN